eukprot:7577588-Karenia_brevis.AAC.1
METDSNRRLAKFGTSYQPLAAQEGSQTLLERVVLDDAVRAQYLAELQEFQAWVMEENMAPGQTPEAMLL